MSRVTALRAGRRARLPSAGALGLVALALLLTAGAVAAHRWSNVGLAFDGDGYYAYLPAWLVQHDPSFRTFVAVHPTVPGIFFPQPGGAYLDKYPVGTAVLILPFFVAGELVGVVTGHGGGGYGTASQVALSLSMIVWCLVGVRALHAVLRRHVSVAVSIATIACVVFGTDLFHYTTHEPAFSHAYSFGLVSLLLLAVLRRHEGDTSLRLAAGIGVLCGLILMVRPSNVVLLLVVPLLGVTSPRVALDRVRSLRRRWQGPAVMTAATVVTFLPQVVVWLVATGRPLVYSYGENHEYFELAHPHVVDVLFSFGPHGLLPWSPVLALAVAGLWPLRRVAPEWLPALAVVLPLNLYVIAAWYQWWYGGGFGLRPFIDSLPLMALPLAALFAALRRPVARLAVAAVAAACVVLTMTMMARYWRQEIAPDGIPAREYLRVLLGH